MTREEAIKVLRETYCGNRAFCELFKVDLCRTTDCEIYHAIKALDAEPTKHGRWKPFDLTWGRSIYACTNCGEAFEVPTEMETPIFIYCPNCGARMIHEVEE